MTRTRLGCGIPIAPKPTDLGAVCQDVIEEAEAQHPDRTVLFEPAGSLRGEWDGDRITQVISNLVSNAIQHGSEDRPISLGLGLFIVREIVAAHGGNVRVTSSVEEGTTFAVRLPRRPPRRQEHPGAHR